MLLLREPKEKLCLSDGYKPLALGAGAKSRCPLGVKVEILGSAQTNKPRLIRSQKKKKKKHQKETGHNTLKNNLFCVCGAELRSIFHQTYSSFKLL